MSRPVFDINEYELRGLVPDVFTDEQKALLNKTLARANGQIDWTAQMLGYNGPAYWGRANLKKDGTYNWVGLPETMNEKRQLQAGTFGVFNKDKDYTEWPAPFNRSEIKASGDADVHVWVEDGKTNLGPLGQPQTTDYGHKPVFYVGATYVFDQHVEFTSGGSDPDQAFWSTTFYKEERLWTRLKVKQSSTVIGVRLFESADREAFVDVIDWQDPSDWSYTEVVNNFLGVWGNKGASLSFDAQFDALDVHGFDERNGLVLDDVATPITLTQLLAKVGLEPTEWTPYWNTKFGFKIGGCVVTYPLPTVDPGELYNNDRYDRLELPTDDYLTDGFFGEMAPPENVADEGEYERAPYVPEYLIPDNFEFFECEADCSYEMDLTQTYSDDAISGIGAISFQYATKADCALIDFPCTEWVFDPSLDNGELEDTVIFPTALGPWATANDGIYEEALKCFSPVKQGEASCEGGVWCGFDDGEFDERTEPDCAEEPVVTVQGCLEADGGFYTVAGPPDYDDCLCSAECCEINNDFYVYGTTPYLGPEKADGGEYEIFGKCVIYDNDEFDRDNRFADCLLDNGPMAAAVVPTSIVDSRNYDRVYEDCTDCSAEDQIQDIPCPVDPVHVSLEEIFNDVTWSMRPTMRNNSVPLRLWKSRPLTALDEAPADGTTHYNYLVADENQGPDELGAYRHFARLPLEYPREGKFWNRTQAVCDNQSYFSAPPNLAQTSNVPKPLRPQLYGEHYYDTDEPDYSVFYAEHFLVSVNRADFDNVQEGFEDAKVTFEDDSDIPFAFAVISDYNAFDVRTPYPNGEWRGSYYKTGSNGKRTGFLATDLASQNLTLVPEAEVPISDMSSLLLPNVEFPDSVDEAAMKNYVVSYAYFVCDFSAADDPVFDPQIEHCWRNETINCSTPQGDECVTTTRKSNTAYLLHSPN